MLYRDNEILIFDEPTAVLTPQEIDELMQIMKNLSAEGKSILFISHKLNEIMSVADRVTVLRKGKCIGTVNVKDTTKEELSRMMVGRDVEFVVHKDEAKPGDVVLSVKRDDRRPRCTTTTPSRVCRSTCTRARSSASPVLTATARPELVYGITGLEPVKSGHVELCGHDITHLPIRKRSLLGMSHIPEDRHKHGLVLDYPLEYNMILQRYFEPEFTGKGGFPKRPAIRAMPTGSSSSTTCVPVRGAVTIARACPAATSRKPSSPESSTREAEAPRRHSADARAGRRRDRVYSPATVATRDAGGAVLLVSLELDEVMNVSDRILVMYEGEIVGELDPKKTTVEELGLYMAGAKREGKKA